MKKLLSKLLLIVAFIGCLSIASPLIKANASSTFDVYISSCNQGQLSTLNGDLFSPSAMIDVIFKIRKNNGSTINFSCTISDGASVVYSVNTTERWIGIPENTFSFGKTYTVSLTATNDSETCYSTATFSTVAGSNPSAEGNLVRAGRFEAGKSVLFAGSVLGNGGTVTRVHIDYSGTSSGTVLDVNPNAPSYNFNFGSEGFAVGNYTFYLWASVDGGSDVLLMTKAVEIWQEELPDPPTSFEAHLSGAYSEYDANATIITGWSRAENTDNYYVSLCNLTKGTYPIYNVDCRTDRTYTIVSSYLEEDCDYEFTVRAVNAAGSSTASLYFKTKKDVVYIPSFGGSGLSSEYRIGDTVSLSGAINGNGGKIESATAYMTDGYGRKSLVGSITPNDSFVYAHNLLKFVAGERIIYSEGTYTFEIYARTTGGEDTKIYTTTITVKKKDTCPGKFSIIAPTYNDEVSIGDTLNVSWTKSENTGYYVVILQNQFKKEVRKEYNVGNTLSCSIKIDDFFEPDFSYTLYVIAHDEDPEDDDINSAQVQIIIGYSDEDEARISVDLLKIKYQSGDSEDSVTRDISLPSVVNTHKVTWKSKNTKYLSNTGVVTRPEVGDEVVELSATIYIKDDSYRKTFYLTIKGKCTESKAVETDASKLAIGYRGTDNASKVTQNITLPTLGPVYESTIEWRSSNSDVIDKYGNVVKPERDTTVTLAATIKNGKNSLIKTFTVVVEGKSKAPICSGLSSSYTVKEDAKLTINGTVTSDVPITVLTVNIENKAGKNTDHRFTPNTKSFNLSKVTIDFATLGLEPGTYTLKVWAKTSEYTNPDKPIATSTVIVESTAIEKLAADKDALSLGFASGNSSSKVTDDIKLPKTGSVNKSSISWKSSDTSIISAKGVVTRPASDTKVKLTATLTLNGKSVTKSFNVTVKAKEKETQKISVSGTKNNGVLTINISHNLTASETKKVSKTCINLYDKDNNNALVDSYSCSGALTSYSPKVKAGKYGVEVVYYDSKSNVICRGENLATLDLTLTSDSLVSSITQGMPATLYGEVSSTSKIKTIKVEMVNSKGKALQSAVSVSPKAKTYSLGNSTLDNKIRFDLLPVGTAKVNLTITDNSGNTLTRSYSLKVIEKKTVIEVSKEPGKPVLSQQQMSYTINEGGALVLDGVLSSNSAFTEVSVVVANHSETRDAINCSSYDVYECPLSMLMLKTSDLKAGNYTIKVYAKTKASSKTYTVASLSLTVEKEFGVGLEEFSKGQNPTASDYQKMYNKLKKQGKLIANEVPYYYADGIKYAVYIYDCEGAQEYYGFGYKLYIDTRTDRIVTDNSILYKLNGIDSFCTISDTIAYGLIDMAGCFNEMNVAFQTTEGVLKGCEFIGGLVGTWASAGVGNLGAASTVANATKATKLAACAKSLKTGLSTAAKTFAGTALPSNVNDAIELASKTTLIMTNIYYESMLTDWAGKILNKEIVSFEDVNKLYADIQRCIEIENLNFEFGVDLFDVPKNKIEAFYKTEKAYFAGVTSSIWKPVNMVFQFVDFSANATKLEIIEACNDAGDMIESLGEVFGEKSAFLKIADGMDSISKYAKIAKGAKNVAKLGGWLNQVYSVLKTPRPHNYYNYTVDQLYGRAYNDMLNNK